MRRAAASGRRARTRAPGPVRWARSNARKRGDGRLRLRSLHHRGRLRAACGPIASPHSLRRAGGGRRGQRYLGGTCVNVGCIPKKLLVHASHFARRLRRRDPRLSAGVSRAAIRFDWSTLIANKDREIARLNGVYAKAAGRRGRRALRGPRATIVDAHTVEVGGSTLQRREHPDRDGRAGRSLPEIPGDRTRHHLERDLPPRGASATRIADRRRRLHRRRVRRHPPRSRESEVTQLYRGPLFLRGFDDDVRRGLAEQMLAHGGDRSAFRRANRRISSRSIRRCRRAHLTELENRRRRSMADFVHLRNRAHRAQDSRDLGLEEPPVSSWLRQRSRGGG